MILNLNDNEFEVLTSNVFAGLLNLKTLYLRDNSLKYLHKDLFTFAGRLALFTDTNIMCCFTTKSTTCNASIEYKRVICTQVLSSFLSNTFGIAVGIYCITVSVSILYQKLRNRQYNSQFVIIILAPVTDILSLYLLIQICTIDFIYSKTYPWVRLSLLKHILCRVQSILTLFIQFTSKLLNTITTAIYYRVTIRALVRRPYTQGQVITCLLPLILLVLATSTIYTVFIRSYNILFCSPFGSDVLLNNPMSIFVQIFVIFINSALQVIVIITDLFIVHSIRSREKYLSQNTAKKKTSRTSTVQGNLMRSTAVQLLSLLFQCLYMILSMVQKSRGRVGEVKEVRVVARVSNDVFYILLSAFVCCNCTSNLMHHGTGIMFDTYQELHQTVQKHLQIVTLVVMFIYRCFMAFLR